MSVIDQWPDGHSLKTASLFSRMPTIPPGALTPDQEFPAKHAAPELSVNALAVLSSVQKLAVMCPDSPVDLFPVQGQELLDAGLVARTSHTDGRVTYRLTVAGKRWRAASPPMKF